MNATVYALIAVCVSAGGLGWICVKLCRFGRVYAQPLVTPGNGTIVIVWLVTLLPGLVLLASGDAEAFLMWVTALPVAGWIVVVRRPFR